MPKSRAIQRQLGQYWTPEVLADFMLDIAQFQPDWKVIDPACGEGVFLKRALERGARQVVGIDIDPETLERARENLKPYGDRVRLYLQDGLLPIEDPDPYWQADYDLVIGNPPFAATGYRVRDPEDTGAVRTRARACQRTAGAISLFESDEYRPKRRKPSVAIEVLFLERFFQLCKPGGVVCLIVPRGILANRNLMYVRKWLTTRYSLRCVFDMPQEAFKSVGANALGVHPAGGQVRHQEGRESDVGLSFGCRLERALRRAFERLAAQVGGDCELVHESRSRGQAAAQAEQTANRSAILR
jgi:predicted RNA methylase